MPMLSMADTGGDEDGKEKVTSWIIALNAKKARPQWAPEHGPKLKDAENHHNNKDRHGAVS